ncbi:MAG TPA: PqqD family peptide modification chaperone [Nitrososphaera sp.]|jgi:metal-sulfur cluster biosynthetic enzyme|nr:PqqD family peptide modification chaperone [Nitrososphaera sp.]HEX2169212.1 PqqD family peptide modification chaperone [Nitrososphaera sp.]
MSTQQTVTEEQVYAALKKCMDPEIPVNVVDLGLIYGVKVADGKDVDIKMTMTTRGCPLHDTLVSDVKRFVGKVNGVGNINVDIVWDPPWSLEKMNQDVREKLGFGKPKLRFQIDYEKSKPMKMGRFSKQDDGSLILANNKDQGFMVNEAIVEFWNACDGTKTINQITDQFSAKLGLPRQQVEQEAVQLLQQLLEAELLQA